MTDANSKALFAAAQLRIPGGVNSPVRAFGSVGGEPVFIQRAKGPHLYGADGSAALQSSLHKRSFCLSVSGWIAPSATEAITSVLSHLPTNYSAMMVATASSPRRAGGDMMIVPFQPCRSVFKP